MEASGGRTVHDDLYHRFEAADTVKKFATSFHGDADGFEVLVSRCRCRGKLLPPKVRTADEPHLDAGLSKQTRAGGVETLSGGRTGWTLLEETRRCSTWQQETMSRDDATGRPRFAVYEKRDGTFARLPTALTTVKRDVVEVEAQNRATSSRIKWSTGRAGPRHPSNYSEQWECPYCGGRGRCGNQPLSPVHRSIPSLSHALPITRVEETSSVETHQLAREEAALKL